MLASATMSPGARKSRTDLRAIKARSYLQWLLTPPAEHAEVDAWQLTPRVPLGAAVSLLAADVFDTATVHPASLLTGTIEGVREEIGHVDDLRRLILSTAVAFAVRRDAAFSSAEIRREMKSNLRRTRAGVLLTQEAATHPERFPDLLVPADDALQPVRRPQDGDA